ncbi:hypothetical protein ACNOYE_38250 [Nannocystaceae bacterium ST9]
MSTSRPPTSLAIPSICLLALGLGCATGSEELDESTFASFDTNDTANDEIDTDTEGDTATGTDSTTGDGDTTTSDGDTSETTTSDATETTASESTDMPDPCGDGMIDPGEDCDGVDLGGATCVDQGFDQGALGCNDDCTFDVTACETIEEFCGDGIINGAEQCEANMLGNATCVSTGFVFGTLGCNAGTCMFDTSGCQNAWIEDFEDGVVPPGWSSGGSLNWGITNADKHAGSWGAKAGAITHSQISWAQVTVTYPIAGSVSFWHKIGSESGYDYGRFSIDGVQQNEWSGVGAWAQFNAAVGAGQHTFRWSYEKDGSVNTAPDTWYVDDVTFTGGYVP